MTTTGTTAAGAPQATTRLYEKFDPRHFELFARTWASFVAKSEGKAITEARMRRIYEANPAGTAALTVVEEAGRWIAAITAIPERVICADGSRVIAYQFSDLVVDPDYQRRGLGRLVVREMTRFLREQALRAFTFPNRRSLGVFLGEGFVELRSIPTVVYPVWPAAAASRLRGRGRAQVREVTLDEACRVADELISRPLPSAGIEKSGAYLRWRYCETRDVADYHFTVVERPDADAAALVVWSLFPYRGVRFQVVVDTVTSGGVPAPLSDAAAAALGRGALMAMNHVERVPGRRLPLLGVRVPRRLDPRPVPVQVPPNDIASQRLLAECRFTTGDWLGF